MGKHTKLAGVLIGVTAAGILGVGWIGGCAGNRAQTPVMPFGDSASVIYAQELWAALTAANLVGPTAKRSKLYKGQVGAVTVMFKREAGYDPENKDWFWVKYKPDGTLHINPKGMALAGRVAKGMDQGCIACHKAVAAKDYIFGKHN